MKIKMKNKKKKRNLENETENKDPKKKKKKLKKNLISSESLSHGIRAIQSNTKDDTSTSAIFSVPNSSKTPIPDSKNPDKHVRVSTSDMANDITLHLYIHIFVDIYM
jgi:hypothetical protein